MEPKEDEIVPSPVRTHALAIFFGVGAVVLVLFLAFVFVKLWPIIVLLVISLMLVASLAPLVAFIRTKFNRKIATRVVVFTLLVGVMGLIVLTIPPIAGQLSTLSDQFSDLSKQLQASLAERSPELAKMIGQVKISPVPGPGATDAVKEVAFSAVGIVTGFVTILMLTVYLLVEGPDVATKLVKVYPREKRLQVRQMVGEMGDQVGAYLRGQLITSFLAGLSTYIVLTIFGVPNALALAWLMAIADAIPIAGPVLGMIPPVISAYAVQDQKGLYVLIALLIYHQIENYLVVPHVYGRALNLSPLSVLLSILVGASLLGMVGAFLALPFAAIIPILWRHFQDMLNLGDDRPDLEGDPALAT